MPKLTRLGKYEIRRELGKGGMGIVYEGLDPFIQRAVAIKTVQLSKIDPAEAEEAISRFRREAQAAGRLSHPRIVSIYEYNEENGMAFIAMELVDGQELKDYFDRKTQFSLEESVDIILQLLDALDHSHRYGVVHRDIKPANVFITGNRQVKVADFGIAKIEASHLTLTGNVLGTPSYMSPEQLDGQGADRRSDIYSTGVILYQLLAGRRPFTGSMITIMHKTLHQSPEPPSKHNPEIPEAFDEIVLRAMAKQPAGRYQSAAEFIEAVKQASKRSAKTNARVPTGGDREAWASIRDSLDPRVFRQYLDEHPRGEFVELAQLRLKRLEQEAIEALKAEELRKLNTERQAQLAAALARQQLETGHRGKAPVGIARKKGTSANQALRANRLAALQAKASELRTEADHARQLAEEKRRQETEEQARRAEQLSGLMEERTRKISEIVARREAEADARKKIEAESLQKLRARRKLRRKSSPE